MEIKTFTSSQLHTFIQSDEFKTMPVIPISTHRALSHMANPRLESKDVILIMAYEDVEMVGYLGVLADKIFAHDKEIKCGWLSCMWVNPTLRGKGIAKKLLQTAFEKWEDTILVTEFTLEAKGLYDRSENFNDLTIKHGLRCYLRFNLQDILPKKNERFKSFIPLLKIADAIANFPNDILLAFKKQAIRKPLLDWKNSDTIDDATNAFIQKFQNNSFEKRAKEELNWIKENPWVQESAPTHESSRYHFSSVDKRFKNIFFTAKDTDKNTVAFLFITIRNGHLKIPYAFFAEQHTSEIVAQLYKIAFAESIDMLTVFHPSIVSFLSKKSSPFIYKREIKRPYIISKKLDVYFTDKSNLTLQDGDADAAFT